MLNHLTLNGGGKFSPSNPTGITFSRSQDLEKKRKLANEKIHLLSMEKIKNMLRSDTLRIQAIHPPLNGSKYHFRFMSVMQSVLRGKETTFEKEGLSNIGSYQRIQCLVTIFLRFDHYFMNLWLCNTNVISKRDSSL